MHPRHLGRTPASLARERERLAPLLHRLSRLLLAGNRQLSGWLTCSIMSHQKGLLSGRSILLKGLSFFFPVLATPFPILLESMGHMTAPTICFVLPYPIIVPLFSPCLISKSA